MRPEQWAYTKNKYVTSVSFLFLNLTNESRFHECAWAPCSHCFCKYTNKWERKRAPSASEAQGYNSPLTKTLSLPLWWSLLWGLTLTAIRCFISVPYIYTGYTSYIGNICNCPGCRSCPMWTTRGVVIICKKTAKARTSTAVSTTDRLGPSLAGHAPC